MSTFRPVLVTTVLVVFALAFAATATAVAAPTGPEFGKTRIRTTIEPSLQGETDTDKYEGRLLAGDRLTVQISVKRSSDLRPELTLLDPAGNDVTPEVKTNRSGTRVQIRNFVVPAGQAGTWSVCIAGAPADGGGTTTGEYTIAFRVKNPRPFTAKNQPIAGPATVDHTVNAADGSFVTIILSSKKNGDVATIDAILDPSGNEVPNADQTGDLKNAFTARGRKFVLKNGMLSGGDGDYVVRVAAAAAATYNLKIKQVGNRPVVRGTLELSPLEPRLTEVGVKRGIEARDVTFTGLNLLADGDGNLPGVFFDDVPATVVSADGTSITATPPALPGQTEDVTVDITVQNPDGQASTLPQAFYYAPLPQITGLEDAGGAAVLGGGATGGDTLFLRGDFFSAQNSVSFGGASATVNAIPNATTIELVSPPHAVGQVSVAVTDEFGRTTTTASTFFEYVVPPTITSFNPPFGAVAGGTVVTATGTDFGPTDVFRIDGVLIGLTPGDATTFTFVSPAKAAGTYSTSLEGKFGLLFAGPSFEAKAPPTISTAAATGGPFSTNGEVPLVMNDPPTVVTVGGTNFRSDDTVEVDGATPGTVTFGSATSFTFEVEAHAAGQVDLTVTDVLGQSATLSNALHHTGYEVATGTRVSPASSATDDFSAVAGAVGDLDNDGVADDLVIAGNSSPGTRSEYTRIFLGSNGTLTDATGTRFPSAYSDYSGIYNWSGGAAAIGDVDGSPGNEIIVAGTPIGGAYYSRYEGYYGYQYGGTAIYTEIYDNGVRTFTNDGKGTFTLDQSLSATVVPYGGLLDQYKTYYPLYKTDEPVHGFGNSTALCIGDLDGDGDNDVVVGTDHYTVAFLNMPLNYVTLDRTDPNNHYASYNNVQNYHYEDVDGYGYYYYASGTRLLLNQPYGYDKFRDVTALNMPVDLNGTNAALVARSLCLGDLDGDKDLDLVVTTDDPNDCIPYDIFNHKDGYTGGETTTVATRVLLNDGYATFTDATSTWLPAGSGNEWWQGNASLLTDIVGDANLDLILVHAVSVDEFTGTTTFGSTALRILLGNGSSFSDVTSSVIPALPSSISNDNFRGETVVVTDVDGDSLKDIVIGTRENLTRTADGSAIRSTRVLLGTSGGTFKLGTGFLPATTSDRGEAGVLLLGDFDGTPRPQLISVTDSTTVSNGDHLRVFDWKR